MKKIANTINLLMGPFLQYSCAAGALQNLPMEDICSVPGKAHIACENYTHIQQTHGSSHIFPTQNHQSNI